MRTVQTIFCCLLPFVSAAVVGCGTATEDVGTGRARIVLTSQGSTSAALHVTATDDATGTVALDRSVALGAGKSSVLDVALDPTAYTLHVDAMRTGDGTGMIGSTDAHADLAADQTKEIRLTARDDGSAGGGSVTVSVDTAPMVHGIQVKPASDGTAIGAVDPAQITVDASDPDGGNVKYFWSGLGIDGATEGTATLSLSSLTAATLGAPPVVHLVVQDSAGATTVAAIRFAASKTCLLCGTATVTMGAPMDGGGSSACLDARAQCNAACDGGDADPAGLGDVACLTSCGIVLASCLSN